MKKIVDGLQNEKQKGQKQLNTILAAFILLVALTVFLPFFVAIMNLVLSTITPTAISTLEGGGYVVLAAGEYESISTKLDNIKISADAAVANADAAVTAAENAVTAAETAAAKVDLFNSAEVYLFPSVTNVTVTLTAGDTNVWSDWTEIADSNAVTLSSKFATDAGYISDMYIYDHSAVDKLYCLEISYGVAKVPSAKVMYHTSFMEMAPIKSIRIPAGETVYYRLMSSGANGATAKVGFRYFYE